MNIAYFWYEPTGTRFQLTFRILDEKCRIDRVFNFSRNITENLTNCLNRIKNNVEKEFVKRSKKKKGLDAPSISVELYKEDELLGDGSFSEYLSTNSIQDLVLKISNQEFRLVFNSPWVAQIGLPTSILAGFMVYPSKLDLKFAELSKSTIRWYHGQPAESKNDKDIEWTQVGEGFTYTVTTDDINHKLKVECFPRNDITEGPSGECISKCVVQAGPGVCPFEIRNQYTKQKLSGDKFRVMSYNLLADHYANTAFAWNNFYKFCPGYALIIDYRKQLFIKEIIDYNADIICLQEVDTKIYDFDLKFVLENFNFKGCFKAKGNSSEGLATFYNTNRFEFIRTDGLNIGESIATYPAFAKLFAKIKNNEKLLTRISDRATAVQATIIRSIDRPDQIIVVANTHLYFHPDADHIRLLQIGFSMLFAEDVIKKLKSELNVDGNNISLIFCGDFNSTPNCGIYKLMTDKFVGADMIDWNSKPEEAVLGVTLSQPYTIESACGCPKYTHFLLGFADCIDYIFYQTDKLRVDQIVPMPSDDELKAHSAIPSVVFPSDHIALVADFQWK